MFPFHGGSQTRAGLRTAAKPICELTSCGTIFCVALLLWLWPGLAACRSHTHSAIVMHPSRKQAVPQRPFRIPLPSPLPFSCWLSSVHRVGKTDGTALGWFHAMFTVAAALEFLEQWAPVALAAAWDNVGLLLGDRDAEVQRIMTCLTVTPESATEAIESGAQLIVTHHPILFRPVKRLTSTTPEGRLLLGLVRAGVAVYSAHTAFDNTRGGINEMLAGRLQLRDVTPLRPPHPTLSPFGWGRGQGEGGGARKYKLVVFVPDADLVRVADALFAAGAGNIGQYSQCSFRLAGTGTFFGSEATHPTVGQKGRREEVSEWRLEAVCPEAAREEVITALRQAHSYEEPAFDVYPLQPRPSRLGEGRIGKLAQPVPLRELAHSVKTLLQSQQLPLVGDPDRLVEKVAIVCGAGGELLAEAVRAQADVLLTGELRFHDYLSAQAAGLALLLPGHYATERLGVEELAARLQKQWPEVQVWASRREHDPLYGCDPFSARTAAFRL